MQSGSSVDQAPAESPAGVQTHAIGGTCGSGRRACGFAGDAGSTRRAFSPLLELSPGREGRERGAGETSRKALKIWERGAGREPRNLLSGARSPLPLTSTDRLITAAAGSCRASSREGGRAPRAGRSGQARPRGGCREGGREGPGPRTREPRGQKAGLGAGGRAPGSHL